MIALLLAVVAAAGFLIATFLVDSTLGTSRRFHHLSVVVAAGILLGVAFADLVPESLELLGGVEASAAIASGFLALFLVEAFTGGHTHHHEPHGRAHEHAADHVHDHGHGHSRGADLSDPCVTTHAIVPFLIGLGVHNFVDGLVIGASHETSDTAASAVTLGILVHQLPVGLSFAAVLVASGVVGAQMRRSAALVAAVIPLGALVVMAGPELADRVLGGLVGFAAGALLYIAAGHLLPEAHSEERRPGVAIAFAVALLGTVLLVGAMHETAHEGDVHAAGAEEHSAPT